MFDRDIHGVVTVDFIFATLVITMVMAGVITIIADRMDAVEEAEELGNARMLAENVAEAINKAYSGGNGHAIKITLPLHINNNTYRINVNSSGVFVRVNRGLGKAYIVPKRIRNTNSPSSEDVVMLPGNSYTIYNLGASKGLLITPS